MWSLRRVHFPRGSVAPTGESVQPLPTWLVGLPHNMMAWASREEWKLAGPEDCAGTLARATPAIVSCHLSQSPPRLKGGAQGMSPDGWPGEDLALKPL